VANAHSALSLRDRIVTRFATDVGSERYRRYFGSQVRLTLEDRAFCVSAPTAFLADWLRRRFESDLRKAASRVLGEHDGDDSVDVEFQVDARLAEQPADGPAGRPTHQDSQDAKSGDASPAPKGTRAPHANSLLSSPSGAGASGVGGSPPAPTSAPRARASDLAMRLEDFIVVRSNELAFHAARRLLEEDGPRGFSPLFIHGACGLGKTHLLRGLAARFREAHPGSRVRFTTGEAFTNAFIHALRRNEIDAFRRKHRDIDLLCIDDIHFLSNKSATQNEFLHTFNAIGLDGARLALASDEHPSRIGSFSKELISRFVAGMVVRIDRPDRTMRLEITRRLAQRRGLPLDDSAIAAIASRCVESIREIEGALTKIEALTRLLPDLQRPSGAVTVAVVDMALERTAPPRPTRSVSVQTILQTVCDELRIDPSEVYGRCRHKRVVLARSLTAYLARQMTTLSYCEIAAGMHRPNHSTIVTAVQRIEKQIEEDAACDGGADLEGVSVSELAERLDRRIAHQARAA